MKALFLSIALALISGCAHTEFSAWSGPQQIWKTGTATVQTFNAIPIYNGLPDRAWKMVGTVYTTGSPADAAQCAKQNSAAALIYGKSMTVHSGDFVFPGSAHTSINGQMNTTTYGAYSYGTYSATANTVYTPPTVIPRYTTHSYYYAIRWATTSERIRDARTLLHWSTSDDDQPIRETLQKFLAEQKTTAENILWLANQMPNGGTITNSSTPVTFTADQVHQCQAEAESVLKALADPITDEFGGVLQK